MRRVRLAVLIAAVMTAAVVTVALAFEREEPLGPPARAAATGEWRALAPAGLERTEVAAARIGRSIYVAGGFEKRSGLSTGALERYDIRTNRWQRLRSMPVGLNHPTAAAYRGKLYVHGGYTGRRDLSSATARLFAYSPRTNRWKRLPKSARPRAAHALAVLGGRLYAFGGKNDEGEMRSMEAYDFKRRRWRAAPPMKGPARDHMTGVAAGGFLYALAGRDLTGGPGNFATAERYDPRRRRWQRLASMRKARGGIASAKLSGGRVIVFGGEESAGTIREVEIYEPKQRRWRSLPDMRTPRHGLGGVSLNDRVYSIQGGPSPGFFFSNAIEFLDIDPRSQPSGRSRR
jgi:N-acetylneuraminic acid mutarotase